MESQHRIETRFRNLFEQSRDGIIIYDLEGRIQDVNSQMCEMLGYEPDQMLSRFVSDFRPEALDAYIDKVYDELVEAGSVRFESQFIQKDGQVIDVDVDFPKERLEELVEGLPQEGSIIVEGTHRRKDGSLFPVEVRVGRLEFEGEWAVMAIARDVTERKQLEEQLFQSQKMEAIGKLAGGVAHDFNNLLTVINGYTAQFLRRLDDHDPLRNYAEQIQQAGHRAAALTNQLLAFSRRQISQPEILDLNTVLVNMLKMLQRLIGEDIDLVAFLGASNAQVKADPNQLEQVIMNLAVNARDAMPTGGKLTIETANVVLDAAFTQQQEGMNPGEYVKLIVRDTGCGMDETTTAQIFEPFFTTKELGEGTGLGLSMVYGIVKQSGGCIQVESEVGSGAAFHIYLPQNETALEYVYVAQDAPLAEGNETILLVEDEALVREFTRQTLEDLGYVVLSAANGDSACRLFEKHQGQVDLLLTDVVMPHMSGRDLAARLEASQKGLKVLFMSGYTADIIGRHGVLDSDVAFIQKPFMAEDLSKKVREFLTSQ